MSNLSLSDVLILANVPTDFIAELDSYGNYLYVGTAKANTPVGNPGWQIKKFLIAPDNATPIQSRFADGTDTFDKVWTLRHTYSYLDI